MKRLFVNFTEKKQIKKHFFDLENSFVRIFHPFKKDVRETVILN